MSNILIIDMEEIYKWQELIGSLLGPFLAIILSIFGFWLKSHIEFLRSLRENFRRIEVSLTRSINDLYDVREELRGFIERLDCIITSIGQVRGETAYCTQETNFPPIADVFEDIDLPNLKIRSYYLHNKLLFVDAGIKNINKGLERLRDDYRILIQKNERLVEWKGKASDQRIAYIVNLKGFRNIILKCINYIDIGIKTITQAKIYLDKRRNNRRFFIWKHEGITFKYFKNKNSIDDRYRSLNLLDRIDLVIENEVKQTLSKNEEKVSEKYKNSE